MFSRENLSLGKKRLYANRYKNGHNFLQRTVRSRCHQNNIFCIFKEVIRLTAAIVRSFISEITMFNFCTSPPRNTVFVLSPSFFSQPLQEAEDWGILGHYLDQPSALLAVIQLPWCNGLTTQTLLKIVSLRVLFFLFLLCFRKLFPWARILSPLSSWPTRVLSADSVSASGTRTYKNLLTELVLWCDENELTCNFNVAFTRLYFI